MNKYIFVESKKKSQCFILDYLKIKTKKKGEQNKKKIYIVFICEKEKACMFDSVTSKIFIFKVV